MILPEPCYHGGEGSAAIGSSWKGCTSGYNQETGPFSKYSVWTMDTELNGIVRWPICGVKVQKRELTRALAQEHKGDECQEAVPVTQ